MLTKRTKRQLLAFVFITLVGVSYVGARFARLDRLVYDSSYQVNAHFEQSGGIFTGAETPGSACCCSQQSDVLPSMQRPDIGAWPYDRRP